MAKETIATSKWVKYPKIYEINSWVWLSELSEKCGRVVDFSSVPGRTGTPLLLTASMLFG
jgi:hypothetical protein